MRRKGFCEEYTSPTEKSPGEGVEFTERGGKDVSFAEKAGASVSFAEKTVPEQSFEQTAEWDFTEVLKYCDEIDRPTDDAVIIAKPILVDSIQTPTDNYKHVVVRFGDAAVPDDNIVLTGVHSVGVVKRITESLGLADAVGVAWQFGFGGFGEGLFGSSEP